MTFSNLLKKKNMLREPFEYMMIVVFLSTNLICYSLADYNFIKILYSLSFIVVFFLRRKLVLTFKSFFFFIITLFLLIVSLLFFDYPLTSTYLLYFLLFSFFSFVVIDEKIKLQLIIKSYTIVLFLLSLPLLWRIYSDYFDSSQLLGISYLILPGFFCSLLGIFHFSDRLGLMISCTNVLVYSYFFLTKGNRGALLCIISVAVLYFIFNKKTPIKLRIYKFIFIILLFILLYLNIYTILSFFSHILSLININIYALDKTMDLVRNNQDIDSGRTYIFNQLLSVLTNPKEIILGKGIGFFEYYFQTYTHNLFTQYYIEGGIGYLLVPIYLSINLIYLLFRSKKKELALLIFLTSTIVVQLMLSNVYWLQPLYWILAYYVFFLDRQNEIYISYENKTVILKIFSKDKLSSSSKFLIFKKNSNNK